MGDSSGKAKSSGSSKAGMQKKQGQEEANQVLQDLGYRTEGQNVFNDTGQVAGPGFSGSRAVDAVRDAAYRVGLQPGGLGTSGSPLEVQQIAAITGRTPEEVEQERMTVSDVYGRPPVRKLGIDKFGNPSGYVASAPTLSELGGDIKRAILGGTFGSEARGEPAPENYRGIVGPLANLALPGGILRNMFSNIYGEGKELVTGPVDYAKNLFSGIFSPSATQAVEMNPQTRAYLENFQRRQENQSRGEPMEEPVTAPVEEIVQEELPYLQGYDASIQPTIMYPYGTGSTLVPYEDLINNRLIV
jgi:hypothetical protein